MRRQGISTVSYAWNTLPSGVDGILRTLQGREVCHMKDSKQIDSLIQDVEELIATLADDQSPHVQELKSRVQDAVDSLDAQRRSAGRRIRRYAASVDRYITGYPRLGFATGVLVGGLIVYLAGVLSPKD
jgi:ElaB/YqjD/DUF883 family membrane-anchored ribosome-binding protein